MSLTTSINCGDTSRRGQKWWAAGLLEHCSQATSCSQSQQMFLIFASHRYFANHGFCLCCEQMMASLRFSTFAACYLEEQVLARSAASNKRSTRPCGRPSVELFHVVTGVKSIQYSLHMSNSVFQQLPTHKSCQILNLNHLRGILLVDLKMLNLHYGYSMIFNPSNSHPQAEQIHPFLDPKIWSRVEL